jgi:hypothetical protein
MSTAFSMIHKHFLCSEILLPVRAYRSTLTRLSQGNLTWECILQTFLNCGPPPPLRGRCWSSLGAICTRDIYFNLVGWRVGVKFMKHCNGGGVSYKSLETSDLLQECGHTSDFIFVPYYVIVVQFRFVLFALTCGRVTNSCPSGDKSCVPTSRPLLTLYITYLLWTLWGNVRLVTMFVLLWLVGVLKHCVRPLGLCNGPTLL